jgi:plastocyanin
MKFKILSIFVLVIMITLVLVSCGKVDDISEDNVEVSSSDLAEDIEEEVETESNSPSINTVIIENGQFKPTDVEVRVGGTIEWNNAGDETYTVTLENGDFSEELLPGASVTYTFNEGGIYPYFSMFQPEMHSLVIVE